MATKTAVVVGALGVIGRYIVERLAALPDWQVVGLSRRKGEDRDSVRHISVDLLDASDVERKLAELGDATHVFYCAFQAVGTQAADYAKGISVNRDMLVNAVSGIERVAKRLERVVLVTGTKYYGSHLGPFRTPAKEDDPRHMPPDYYFDQIDWLTAHQSGKRWTWTELRPQTLCGFAPGTAMSIVPVIAVYAAISKELGLPLRFPGQAGRVPLDLPGDGIDAHGKRGAVGGERAALREPGLQHHQRRLFPLDEPVAAHRRGVRHAARRAADDLIGCAHGGQGAAVE